MAMRTVNAVRIGIQLTAEDRKVLRRLKARLQATHGKLTTTAVFRLALRAYAIDNEGGNHEQP